MDPMTLIPRPDPLMVEWGWFQALLSGTFFVHIVLVNIVLGSAAVAMVNTWCKQDCTYPVGHDIATKLPTAIALTVNFGVAPLLFLQTMYGHLFYVSDIIMGWYWLGVIALVIFAYYMAYLYDFNFELLGSLRGLTIGLSLAALIATAFMFTNNVTMMISPDRWDAWFANKAGNVLNWGDPTLIPRFLHFIAASFAVGGLVQALNWRRESKQAEPMADWYVERGMKWFFYGTAAQFILGPWFLLSMKPGVASQFFGPSAIGTPLMLTALTGAFFCLHAGFFAQPRRAAFYFLVTAAAMTGVREIARILYLKPYLSVQDIPVVEQTSPMVMFFIALAAGILIITYILRLAKKANAQGEA